MQKLPQARRWLSHPVVVPAFLLVVVAGAVGSAYGATHHWREGILELAGMALMPAGALLLLARPRPAGTALAAVCAVAGGVATAAGSLLGTGVLAVVAAVAFVRGRCRADALPLAGHPVGRVRTFLMRHGGVLCAVTAITLLLDVLFDSARGELSHHAVALGAHGVAFALLGVIWSAGRDGVRVLGWKDPAAHLGLPVPAVPTALALVLLSAFLGLSLAIRIPAVQALDASLSGAVYHCGGPAVTRANQFVSWIGGGSIMRSWIPLVLVALWLGGRARALRFFAFSMLGALGLELASKAFFHRERPLLTGSGQFDSFPSGHALAATIFAGTLLVLLLPACRRRWQRALIWAAGIGWVVLIPASRFTLGRHYLTDVTAGVLLGAAWVCVCAATLLWLARGALAALDKTAHRCYTR